VKSDDSYESLAKHDKERLCCMVDEQQQEKNITIAKSYRSIPK
jgi:pectate lyase